MKINPTLSPSLFFASLVFIFAPIYSQAQNNPFKEGMKWYEQRSAKADSFLAEPEYINKAIDAFEKAYEQDVNRKQAGLYLLKSYYFKGMFLGLDNNRQKEVFDKGRDLGEKLEERYSDMVEIKFWYAANLGRWAKVYGFVAAATSGVAKKVRRLSEEIIELDKQYQGGGGYRILAQVHFRSPKIPLLMGWPSDKKALELAKKAMEIEPAHPSNRLLYAELLMNFDRKQEARKHLEFILKMEPRPDHLIPDRFIKHKTEELLNSSFEV